MADNTCPTCGQPTPPRDPGAATFPSTTGNVRVVNSKRPRSRFGQRQAALGRQRRADKDR